MGTSGDREGSGKKKGRDSSQTQKTHKVQDGREVMPCGRT